MQAHIFISGFVQGVQFRAFIKQKADALGITGWVRNLPAGKAGTPDERVEVEAFGAKENLEKLVEFCRSGPPGAQVEKVEQVAQVSKGEKIGEFEIR